MIGTWILPAMLLALIGGLLGLAARRIPAGFRAEGWKLLLLVLVPLPWLVEIALAQAYPSGEVHGGPVWVERLAGYAMLANPVLWAAAMILLWKARRCVVPFLLANLVLALGATAWFGAQWAGAWM
ncbi:MAG TPA: hypothetical protein VN805_00120 [Caulobacteraceae bacterium]|nr:hypothetical protein [Caulobacteraceae bacterium]